MNHQSYDSLLVSPDEASEKLHLLTRAFQSRGRVMETDPSIFQLVQSTSSGERIISQETKKSESRNAKVYRKYFGHGWVPEHIRMWQRSLNADGNNEYLLATLLEAPRDRQCVVTVPNHDDRFLRHPSDGNRCILHFKLNFFDCCSLELYDVEDILNVEDHQKPLKLHPRPRRDGVTAIAFTKFKEQVATVAAATQEEEKAAC